MEPSAKKLLIKTLFIIAGCALIVPAAIVAPLAIAEASPKQITTTYEYDAQREIWVKDTQSVSLPRNPDGTKPKGSNTVIIRLSEDNPVKTIVLFNALVVGNASEPRLEIAGHDTLGSGKINIGTLLFNRVEAEKLRIHDTDAVRLQMENAVAEDDELDIDVDVVNVVRTARGGPSTLIIGATRSNLASLASLNDFDLDALPDNLIPPRETGVRVDKIRILGPSSGTGFVERIVILQTSVFGQIEVKDVEIQDIILRNVTVDDSV